MIVFSQQQESCNDALRFHLCNKIITELLCNDNFHVTTTGKLLTVSRKRSLKPLWRKQHQLLRSVMGYKHLPFKKLSTGIYLSSKLYSNMLTVWLIKVSAAGLLIYLICLFNWLNSSLAHQSSEPLVPHYKVKFGKSHAHLRVEAKKDQLRQSYKCIKSHVVYTYKSMNNM